MATRWHGICHGVVAAPPRRMQHWTCILDPSIDRLRQEVLTTVRRRSRYPTHPTTHAPRVHPVREPRSPRARRSRFFIWRTP